MEAAHQNVIFAVLNWLRSAARSQCKPASDVLMCAERGGPMSNLTAGFERIEGDKVTRFWVRAAA